MNYIYWKDKFNALSDPQKEKLILAGLLILSFLMFFYKLGASTFFGADEVVYNQIAKEMVQSGDWLTLHLFGSKWFMNPPFYMWLVSASSLIFGFTEFNARLWNSMFAVGLVYITYLLGKKMFGNGVGLMAAAILATSVQYIIQARTATFDIPLVFFMMLSLYFFFRWSEGKLQRYYYLFFVSLGLGLLMKGLIGPVLPLLVITIYLYSTKSLRTLLNIKLVPGLLLTYIIGGSWYTAQLMIHGRDFSDTIFGFYTFSRFLMPIGTNHNPLYFYVVVIALGFLPWVSFLPYSISYQWKQKGDPYNYFTVLWLMAIFLFFTVAMTKIPAYIMSFYPLAAISVAKMFSDLAAGEGSGIELRALKAFKAQAVISILLIVVAVMFKIFECPDGYEKLFADINVSLMIIGCGGLASALIYLWYKEQTKAFIVMVLAMAVFSFYTASFTMVNIDMFKPMKLMAQKIRASYTGSELIVGYNVDDKESIRHYLDKEIIWKSDIILLRELVNNSGNVLIITNERDFPNVSTQFKKPTTFLYKAGDLILLYKRQ
jgi:hypothetical protein